jgi:hypothetical protein
MPLRFRFALAAVTFALIFSSSVPNARAQQNSLTPDQKQVVDTVSTIFTAARTDDVAKFDSVIAPDFYIFDGAPDSMEMRLCRSSRTNTPHTNAMNGI